MHADIMSCATRSRLLAAVAEQAAAAVCWLRLDYRGGNLQQASRKMQVPTKPEQ